VVGVSINYLSMCRGCLGPITAPGDFDAYEQAHAWCGPKFPHFYVLSPKDTTGPTMICVIVKLADGVPQFFASDRPGGSWRSRPTYLYSAEAATEAMESMPWEVRRLVLRPELVENTLLTRPLTVEDLAEDIHKLFGETP
jgi:hypothetical protein